MRLNGFAQRLKGDVVEMDLYGVIGSAAAAFEHDDFVQTSEVLSALRDMGQVKTLRLFFNSPGGSVYDGFQIANRLDALRADGKIGTIEGHGEGLIASAATLPYLKCNKRTMRNGARFMIHRPWAHGAGTAEEMRAEAKRLDQTEQEALDLYESVSALTREELQAAMAAETYYTPKEAEAAGFATDIVEPFAIAACMSQELRAKYHNLPADLELVDPVDRDQETVAKAELLRQKLQTIRESGTS